QLMLITVKVTYVAFSLHDGLGRKEDQLTKDQNEQSIKRVPSLLEYFGYMFHFSMLLAGPVCTFKDYMDFIEGRDIARATDKKTRKEPSPTNAVLTKLATSVLYMVVFSIMAKLFPFHLNADPDFIANNSLLWRITFAHFAMVNQRTKFYFVWTLADAVNNACGLGFYGYESSGRELWNRLTNINGLEIEKAADIRQMINNWNIQTNLWLKRTIYERVPYQRTFFTFATSVVWHGIYPGYFLVASSSLLLMAVTRKARLTYGHLFRDMSPIKTYLFEFLKWIVGNVILTSYCFVPFVFLRLDLSLIFYR
ncbi:membrane-bound glycerophospholipid O-acyltransferase 2-like, partial [Oculina patagonica]